MSSNTCNRHPLPNLHAPRRRTPFSPQTHFPLPRVGFTIFPGLKSYNQRLAFNSGVVEVHASAWDEKPYEILPTGKISYLDEQDVVTFLDPPKELIPLDPISYNPAAYLWKKIEDIPEERRLRLLRLLNPRLISRAWEIAGTRYDDPKFAKKIASNVLRKEDGQMPLEFYNCRASGGPCPIAWMNFFKKAIFCSDDGSTYGRFISGSIVGQLVNSFSPLYFVVNQLKEVMSTEQPCDLAYEFGDGLFSLHQYPQGFPRPVKHPYPFNDQVVIYIRHVGPGVLVGQAWQEGKELEQLPQKLCGEILMVKDHSAS
ncbi:WD repeat protein [Citrus sinensis]|uniref:WD repeat protein n=1 Tax=Citrus sinensis TaxID=2711 RepID=A0ACB8JED8_CITSI|nr:WD repeat protein [Citrus sinensis]